MVIFLAKKSDTNLHLASQEMVQNQVNDGVFIIISHGAPEGVLHEPTENEEDARFYSNPKRFLEVLSEISPEFKESFEGNTLKTIILTGCNTATPLMDYYDNESLKDEKNFAQRLSETEQDLSIKGATGYVGHGKRTNGKYGVVSVSSTYGPHRRDGNDGYNDKQFVTYEGGRKITKNERGKDVPSRHYDRPHLIEHTKNNNGIKPREGAKGF